ncbi:STAS-like domain-containing protein [Comamonas sp. lk]|uniref:STAS-like domain-containing protein n=1 Tax=Comamonas sp. lk TaxID=2201272 RepID=UPI000EACA64B|nr:STAS-like domain-containing protein [Comamonas sp. lk]
MKKLIVIAKDFSRSPSGRHREDGPFSGQLFREELLVPALKSGAVEVNLDGVLTLGSSFLDEAFGGLVREAGLSVDEIKDKLTISGRIETFTNKAWSHILDPKNKFKK